MICKMTVTTKKGATQDLLFAVRQDRPYPDIEKGGCYHWRNGGGIFREYGNGPKGLSREYAADLLRSDYAEDKAHNNRKDYAGYDGAPGTITLRGVDMGEMTVTVNMNNDKPYASARLRGFDQPTPGERKWIEENIVPALVAFIETNKTELYIIAVNGIEKTMQENILSGYAALAVLETESKAAIQALREKV